MKKLLLFALIFGVGNAHAVWMSQCVNLSPSSTCTSFSKTPGSGGAGYSSPEWSATCNGSTIRGLAVCSADIEYAAGKTVGKTVNNRISRFDASDLADKGCWCKMISPAGSDWVFAGVPSEGNCSNYAYLGDPNLGCGPANWLCCDSGYTDCGHDCAALCGTLLMGSGSESTSFRANLFEALDPKYRGGSLTDVPKTACPAGWGQISRTGFEVSQPPAACYGPSVNSCLDASPISGCWMIASGGSFKDETGDFEFSGACPL